MLQLFVNSLLIIYGLRNVLSVVGFTQKYLKNLDFLGQTYFFFLYTSFCGSIWLPRAFKEYLVHIVSQNWLLVTSCCVDPWHYCEVCSILVPLMYWAWLFDFFHVLLGMDYRSSTERRCSCWSWVWTDFSIVFSAEKHCISSLDCWVWLTCN